MALRYIQSELFIQVIYGLRQSERDGKNQRQIAQPVQVPQEGAHTGRLSRVACQL